MRRREEIKQGIVGKWVHKAEIDLGVAEYLLQEGSAFPSVIAFHCQQAAEKYLKAFLARHEVEFPKTHDLEEILDLVAVINAELATSLRAVEVLTPFGVEIRYPGDRPDAMPEEARVAVALAQRVRDAILPRLQA